jgi:molecular chaperone IbpA
MSTISQYTPVTISRVVNDLDRYSIGFDNLFHRLFTLPEEVSFYPPYNLIEDKNYYYLEMALAGYSKDNLKVYTEEGVLNVEADKEVEKENVKYLQRGLAKRSFKWKRALPDNVHVREVKFDSGILTVTLERVVPEVHQRKDYL